MTFETAVCNWLIQMDCRFAFTDPLPEIKNFGFYRMRICLCLRPRAPEGHPWVIVEALAAGLPIISTDQGAITESVINGVNGYIVPVNSPRRIADKIAIIKKQPDLLNEFGHASRAHYLNNFTEEKMVEKLVYAIDNVLPVQIKQPV